MLRLQVQLLSATASAATEIQKQRDSSASLLLQVVLLFWRALCATGVVSIRAVAATVVARAVPVAVAEAKALPAARALPRSPRDTSRTQPTDANIAKCYCPCKGNVHTAPQAPKAGPDFGSFTVIEGDLN